jgi:hypothetical protein
MKKSFVQKYRSYLLVLTMLIAISSIITLVPRPSATGFKTLDTLIAYAKSIDENIKADTEDTIKPQFNNYYKKFVPTWRSRLGNKLIWFATFLGLHKSPLWSPEFFKSQLDDLSAQREKKNYKGDFVCKISPTLQSKIIIFGNAQGAFHSLVRDLTKLKDLGLIDSSLKVTTPDHFIVFMGDVVSRSPYSMETLSLVMSLMQANPQNLLYLKGNHIGKSIPSRLNYKLELNTSHHKQRLLPMKLIDFLVPCL